MLDDMTDPEHQKDDKHNDADRDFGALLGWTADKFGDRVVLRLQSARQSLAPGEEPRQFTYFLKREQAVLLGHFLYNLAGETPPRSPTRSNLARLFGKP
jgi:hypothetical protein